MILIFGSSIAWGAWDEKGGWAQRIKSLAESESFSSNFKDNTFVYPLGISGDDSRGLLKRFDAEVEARKWDDEKMQIIIAIGMNDSYFFNKERMNAVSREEYRKNLLRIIEKSKNHNADLIFVGLTPVDERVDPVPWRTEISYKIEFVEKYEEVLKNICKEQNIPLIELMSKFVENDPNELLADGIHPNTKGHELIYVEVLEYLKSKNFI